MNIHEFKDKQYVLDSAKKSIERELSVELLQIIDEFLVKVKKEHGEIPRSITINFIESTSINRMNPSYILSEVFVEI